jgi:vancomycin permeability regulator SanA
MPQLMLMGDQARQQFEEDMLRMKQFIERGLPARETSMHTEIGGSVLH